MTGLRHLLKGAAIAVALAAAAVVTTAPASARDGYYSHDRYDNSRYDDSRYNHRRHHRHHRGYDNDGAAAVSLLFGNIAFGYRDGYWDNGHRWHNWRNDGEYRNYRGHRGGNFHDWNHDRDRDNGWRNR